MVLAGVNLEQRTLSGRAGGDTNAALLFVATDLGEPALPAHAGQAVGFGAVLAGTPVLGPAPVFRGFS